MEFVNRKPTGRKDPAILMSPPSLDSLRGRNVFVTGHTGFKGSWLCLWLEQLGATITGYALPPSTQPSNFEASRVLECLHDFHEADIRDLDALSNALVAAKPDVIFHLAAQPLVRESYRNPAETFATNVQGTVNVLEAVRRLGRPCAVVLATSDKCYENREQARPFREEDRLGGHDPYSASKAAAEIVAASYRQSFFAPEKVQQHGVLLATVRAGNVIGGGDWSRDRIVVDIVESLRDGMPVAVRHPEAVRPWQHVLEPLSGYLLLAARMMETRDPMLAGAWNFGPRAEGHVCVRELVEMFLEDWGSGTWCAVPQVSALLEAGVLHLSIKKAARELGWLPRWGVREAVARTARWYKAFTPGTDMSQACLRDLAAYEAAIPVNAAA